MASSTLCQKLKQNGHPCGFSLGHAVGDANGFAEWAAVDAWRAAWWMTQGKVALDSKETINALKYAIRAVQDDDSRHHCLE